MTESANKGCRPEAGRIFVSPHPYVNLEVWHTTATRLRRESPVLRVEAEGLDPFWAGEPEYTASTFDSGPKHAPIRYRLRSVATVHN